MRMSQATSKARTIPVAFEGGDLTVTYRPASYTVRELDELQADSKNTKRIVDSMLRTLVSWDLTDDDDNAIPLEVEPLMDVPTSIFVEIMKAMQADQAPDAEGKS
jgi:hypothetical protein